MYAVTIPPMNWIFFVSSPPGDVPGEVVEGVEIDVVPNIYLSSGKKGTSRDVLCVSKTNPKRFKLFKHADEVEGTGFEPTGKTFGGVLSGETWERVRALLPREIAFASLPDTDLPGAMKEALRGLRGVQ